METNKTTFFELEWIITVTNINKEVTPYLHKSKIARNSTFWNEKLLEEMKQYSFEEVIVEAEKDNERVLSMSSMAILNSRWNLRIDGDIVYSTEYEVEDTEFNINRLAALVVYKESKEDTFKSIWDDAASNLNQEMNVKSCYYVSDRFNMRKQVND